MYLKRLRAEQQFSVSFILEISVSQNLAKVGEEAYKTLGIRMGEREIKRVNYVNVEGGFQTRGWGGGGGTRQMFKWGGSAPRSNLSLFYISLFMKKVPLSYAFY